MNPLILPLNIGKDDTFRISWNNRYFQAKGALVLPHKITCDDEAQSVLTDCQFVLRLIEFKSALRSKMLASLSSGSDIEQSSAEIIGLVVRLNINSGLVHAVEDARKTTTAGASEGIDFLGSQAQELQLSGDEREALISALSLSLKGAALEAIRQPFVAFNPELSESWKEQNLQNIQADKLVPFQMLFPNSQPIERFADGERFVIDDLYCTNPTCNCTDVTCVVLKMLPASGTEVAWCGFKWNIESDKFKPLPQFSNKFSAAEWFKQFDAGSAFNLRFLLKSRQKFMRNQFIAARRQART